LVQREFDPRAANVRMVIDLNLAYQSSDASSVTAIQLLLLM
jgi:hypothetical protein